MIYPDPELWVKFEPEIEINHNQYSFGYYLPEIYALPGAGGRGYLSITCRPNKTALCHCLW